MESFTVLKAVAAPFYHADVDTDELIPHRFLRKPLSAGYGNFLFHDKRRGPDEREDPNFVLNMPAYRQAQILISGPNFGCGSTREGAVYALRDFGIRAVIASGFSDIFSSNCAQNGVVCATLPDHMVRTLCEGLESSPGSTLMIDLPNQQVVSHDGATYRFEIDSSRKSRLIDGRDEIEVTLKHRNEIGQFEAAYLARLPWLFQAGRIT